MQQTNYKETKFSVKNFQVTQAAFEFNTKNIFFFN